jgi:hypothetical protein
MTATRWKQIPLCQEHPVYIRTPVHFQILVRFRTSDHFWTPVPFHTPVHFQNSVRFQGQSNKWYKALLPSPCDPSNLTLRQACVDSADLSTYQRSPLCFSICKFIDAPALGHLCHFGLGYSLPGLTRRGGAPLPASPSTALSLCPRRLRPHSRKQFCTSGSVREVTTSKCPPITNPLHRKPQNSMLRF